MGDKIVNCEDKPKGDFSIWSLILITDNCKLTHMNSDYYIFLHLSYKVSMCKIFGMQSLLEKQYLH